MIEKIYWEEILYAIIIRTDYEADGIEFFTLANMSQQLGYMKRPKGYEIAPHIHKPVLRSVEYTQEVLFIKKGKLKVNFYTEQKVFFKETILFKGDVILLARGGHGFEVLDEVELIEVKQGPYAGDEDKERF